MLGKKEAEKVLLGELLEKVNTITVKEPPKECKIETKGMWECVLETTEEIQALRPDSYINGKAYKDGRELKAVQIKPVISVVDRFLVNQVIKILKEDMVPKRHCVMFSKENVQLGLDNKIFDIRDGYVTYGGISVKDKETGERFKEKDMLRGEK